MSIGGNCYRNQIDDFKEDFEVMIEKETGNRLFYFCRKMGWIEKASKEWF